MASCKPLCANRLYHFDPGGVRGSHPDPGGADNFRVMHASLFLFMVLVLCTGSLSATSPVFAETGESLVHAGLPENPRALWVVRDALTSPTRIRRMIKDAHHSGVTDLLIQVRGRGDAYYPSSFVPIAPALERAWSRKGRFDPLALVIDQAKNHGIRVHAWLNVYLVKGKAESPPLHLTHVHADWVSVDSRGVSMLDIPYRHLLKVGDEGVFLEPGNRRVVLHFARVVDELITTYSLDGIHLDYVRYPKRDVGYGPVMRAGFQRLTGYDPVQVNHQPELIRGEVGTKEYEKIKRQWLDFKADQVTALIRKVRTVTRNHQPNLILSVAVKPDPSEALFQNGQDWVRWINEDLVDVVAPMMYSTSDRKIQKQAALLSRLVPKHRVWPGISVYNQSLASAESKIQTLRETGFNGVSIFSYNSLPAGSQGLKRLNQIR